MTIDNPTVRGAPTHVFHAEVGELACVARYPTRQERIEHFLDVQVSIVETTKYLHGEACRGTEKDM